MAVFFMIPLAVAGKGTQCLQEMFYLPGRASLRIGGGFLNDEMWAQIFSHRNVQGNRKLRKLMLTGLNFENALKFVQTSPDYLDDEKAIFRSAINDAFGRQEAKIRDKAVWSGPVLQSTRHFVEKLFSFGRGYFFTLNQDLFVEKRLFPPSGTLPGHEPKFQAAWPIARSGETIRIPTKEEIVADGQRFLSSLENKNIVYIKVHGSCDWTGSDGSRLMVMGGGKKKAIEDEPILEFYFDKFQNALSEAGTSIIIVGYGFRDDHINCILNDSVKKSGLNIYVILPESPLRFLGMLKSPSCKGLLGGLAGYYPYRFEDFVESKSAAFDFLDSLPKD